jgi:hypothetical protein
VTQKHVKLHSFLDWLKVDLPKKCFRSKAFKMPFEVENNLMIFLFNQKTGYLPTTPATVTTKQN